MKNKYYIKIMSQHQSRNRKSHRRCNSDSTLKVSYLNSTFLDTKKLVTDCIKSKCIKADKIVAESVKAPRITATDDIILDGQSLTMALRQPSQSTDYTFDKYAPDGMFGDRTPVKPPTVNEDVFSAMLLSLKDVVIPKLCERFKKGRKRLSLPTVPTDPDIVASISLPVVFRAWPDSTDPIERQLMQYNLTLGWNLEIANAANLIGSEVTPSSIFEGTVSGNVLTVTSVSYGFVQQGTYVSGVGIPDDVIIIDQISKAVAPDGPFFKEGTYRLAKVVDDVCNPDDVDLNLPLTEITGTLPQGPRAAAIYIHYGYKEKTTGEVKVVTYDLGDRQFEPTIDFDPQDNPLDVMSWGEKYSGYRSIDTNIAAVVWENMPDIDDTGCLQLVIVRETGIIGFFPAKSPDDKAITVIVTNPNCTSDCGGDTITSTSTFSPSLDLKIAAPGGT